MAVSLPLAVGQTGSRWQVHQALKGTQIPVSADWRWCAFIRVWCFTFKTPRYFLNCRRLSCLLKISSVFLPYPQKSDFGGPPTEPQRWLMLGPHQPWRFVLVFPLCLISRAGAHYWSWDSFGNWDLSGSLEGKQMALEPFFPSFISILGARPNVRAFILAHDFRAFQSIMVRRLGGTYLEVII